MVEVTSRRDEHKITAEEEQQQAAPIQLSPLQQQQQQQRRHALPPLLSPPSRRSFLPASSPLFSLNASSYSASSSGVSEAFAMQMMPQQQQSGDETMTACAEQALRCFTAAEQLQRNGQQYMRKYKLKSAAHQTRLREANSEVQKLREDLRDIAQFSLDQIADSLVWASENINAVLDRHLECKVRLERQVNMGWKIQNEQVQKMAYMKQIEKVTKLRLGGVQVKSHSTKGIHTLLVKDCKRWQKEVADMCNEILVASGESVKQSKANADKLIYVNTMYEQLRGENNQLTTASAEKDRQIRELQAKVAKSDQKYHSVNGNYKELQTRYEAARVMANRAQLLEIEVTDKDTALRRAEDSNEDLENFLEFQRITVPAEVIRAPRKTMRLEPPRFNMRRDQQQQQQYRTSNYRAGRTTGTTLSSIAASQQRLQGEKRRRDETTSHRGNFGGGASFESDFNFDQDDEIQHGDAASNTNSGRGNVRNTSSSHQPIASSSSRPSKRPALTLSELNAGTNLRFATTNAPAPPVRTGSISSRISRVPASPRPRSQNPSIGSSGNGGGGGNSCGGNVSTGPILPASLPNIGAYATASRAQSNASYSTTPYRLPPMLSYRTNIAQTTPAATASSYMTDTANSEEQE